MGMGVGGGVAAPKLTAVLLGAAAATVTPFRYGYPLLIAGSMAQIAGSNPAGNAAFNCDVVKPVALENAAPPPEPKVWPVVVTFQ